MFLRKQVKWSGTSVSVRIFQFRVSHTIKGLNVVNEAEIDVFLELSCFFHDPADVGNLISGSSSFSKTSLIDHTCLGLFLDTQFCLDQ